jgi:hypothetical protein
MGDYKNMTDKSIWTQIKISRKEYDSWVRAITKKGDYKNGS